MYSLCKPIAAYIFIILQLHLLPTTLLLKCGEVCVLLTAVLPDVLRMSHTSHPDHIRHKPLPVTQRHTASCQQWVILWYCNTWFCPSYPSHLFLSCVNWQSAPQDIHRTGATQKLAQRAPAAAHASSIVAWSLDATLSVWSLRVLPAFEEPTPLNHISAKNLR